MPHSLFLLFNHTMTIDQEEDARVSLGSVNVITMPDDIRKAWARISPDLPQIFSLLEPVCNWLISEASIDNYKKCDANATQMRRKFY